MDIRPMTLTHVAAVRRLGQVMPESSYTANDLFRSEAELEAWVKAGADTLLVVIEDEAVVGFLLSYFHEPTMRAELEDIFVLESERGRGIGTALMERFIAEIKRRGAQDLYFVVRRNNEQAMRFYRKFFIEGFEFISFGTEF